MSEVIVAALPKSLALQLLISRPDPPFEYDYFIFLFTSSFSNL